MARPRTGGRVRLPPVMDLAAASPLAAELLAVRGRPTRLDASAVERLGGLCLQVLLSARATWAADGVSLAVEGVSAPMQEALALAGAGELNVQAPERHS